MPIEFACEACNQLLRVPDDSQGASCQCPKCHAHLTIPSGAPATQVYPQTAAAEQPARQLKIACPNCRFELICASSLLGTKGQCRNCRTIFTISENPAGRAVTERLGPGVTFNCPQCAQLFEGRAEMEGRKGKCHACGAVFTIQLQPAQGAASLAPASDTARPRAASPRAISPQSSSASAQRPAATADQPPPLQPTSVAANASKRPTASRAKPSSIQFACHHCQGIMEVPGSTAGRTTECPYCQHRMTIPQQSTLPPSPAAASLTHAPAHSDVTGSMGSGRQSAGRRISAIDLGSLASGNELLNPYAAPPADAFSYGDSPGVWDQASPARKLRGLTFGNVFALTFSSLFPYCLVAAASFVLVAGLSLGLVAASAALAGSVVSAAQLDPRTASGMGVIYTVLGIAMIVCVFLVTAVFCMTCNTALHVVRGKKINSQVLFGTGESYGGMLVIMFGWTAFNILRDRGVPWLVKTLEESGQPDTAAAVGLVAVVGLLLIQVFLMLLLAFVPYALLDGQSLPEALASSSSIFFGNFLTVLAVNVCGGLLYVLVSVVTCGLGMIVFIGGLLYLNAAVYRLANKP